MEQFRNALNNMEQSLGNRISELRQEMRDEFAVVHEAIADEQDARVQQQQATVHMQEAMAAMQESLAQAQESIARQQRAGERQQRALLHQSHVLDQGLARLDDEFRAHRENIGTVVFTFVEDLNSVKIDVREICARLDVLEKRTPPAA